MLPQPDRTPRGLLTIAALVTFALVLIVSPDLSGPQRSAAVQAIAAAATFLATVVLLVFSYQAERRSQRAEGENRLTQEAVLQQSNETKRLADSSNAQASQLQIQNALLSQQLEQQTAPKFALFQSNAGKVRHLFIANLGNSPVQITRMITQFEILPMPYHYSVVKGVNKNGLVEIVDYILGEPSEGTLMPGEKQIIHFPIEDRDNEMPEHPGYRSYRLELKYIYGSIISHEDFKIFLIQHEPTGDYIEKTAQEMSKDWNF